jgi:hypothetical protein
MKSDDGAQFRQLETVIDVNVLKKELKSLFLAAIQRHTSESDGSSSTAYDLAGLMALDLVRAMAADDPYRILLELAGNLELPKRHQEAEASWWSFEELVKQL